MSDFPQMSAATLQELYGVLQDLQEKYTYEIDDMSSFHQKALISPEFLYRGQSKTSYHLLPSLFRKKEINDTLNVGEYIRTKEKLIIDEFISESCIYRPDIPRNDYLSWIEIAQHHGLPTRLLDFTSNPLVALYFACVSSNDEDAYVWIVNKPAYNQYIETRCDALDMDAHSQITKIINDEIVNPLLDVHSPRHGFIQFPRIYKPNYYDERMAAQSSFFMLWAASSNALDTIICDSRAWMNTDDKQSDNGVIGRIRIKSASKKNILKQLDISGINEKSIYLGLDGVGRYLCQKYRNDKEGSAIVTDFQEHISGPCTITLQAVQSREDR